MKSLCGLPRTCYLGNVPNAVALGRVRDGACQNEKKLGPFGGRDSINANSKMYISEIQLTFCAKEYFC